MWWVFLFMAFYVYILYASSFDRYYIGQTNNPVARLVRHNHGYEKATSPYVPWDMICLLEKSSRSEALILERKLKNLNREKLKKFIAKYNT